MFVEGMEQLDTGEHLAQAYLDLQRRYRDLVTRGVAGMYRTTLEGRILECNDALAQMLGYADAAELMRQDVLELYPSPAERERFLEDITSRRKLVNYEVRLRHRHGREVHALENVYLVERPEGGSIIQGTIIDITIFRQAELEQSSLMNNYRNLVEHMRDGVLLVTGDSVAYANPAAETMAGMPLTGVALSHLFPAEVAEELHKLLKGPYPANAQFDVRLNGREVIMHALGTLNDGSRSIQLTLQDRESQMELVRERMRVRMAEEVNEVLRREIEEHRRTQEALKRSRRFAQSLIDSSLDMIMAADPQGRITEYNPAAAMRFGHEPQDVLGREAVMLYADKADYDRVQAALDEHGMFAGEITNITSTGQTFTSFLAASRLFDEDGRLLGVMGVSRDITRMKQDQEALRASEERYRDLFENATDLIQSVDVSGRFEYVNAAWKKALGYSDQELEQIRLMDIIHPDHREAFQEEFLRINNGESRDTIRTVLVARDGREVEVVGGIDLRRENGRVVASRSIFRDVTREVRVERRVREHEAKLRALFESSDHMFWTVDPKIKLTSYNRGYAAMIQRLHGVEPEINTDPQRPRKRFADPAYHTFWETMYAEAFSGRTVRFETDRRDVHGGRVCNEVFLSPVFGTDGTVQEVFGVGHEITEQKEAEDRVREQSARLRAIFESSANMMIWTLDRELRVTSCNERFQRSMQEDFGVDMGIGDAFIAADAARAAGSNTARYSSFYKAALKGRPQQFEAELTDRLGNTIWVQNFLNPIMVEGRIEELSCLAYHITDRKESQMAMERSLHEKEVLLKEVHHRVKNNLQIVSSIFSLQSAHVGEDKRMLDLLRDSRDRIRSMSFIHESLYQNKDFSSVDLADYMKGLGGNLMMSYSLTGKVRLETDLQRVDLVLDQAIPCGLILNELISNALKHAFPDGREGTIRLGLSEENGRVSIRLADDGVGVLPGMNPLRNANLGLELVQTLVEQLDGHLEMDTTKGVAYLLTFERSK